MGFSGLFAIGLSGVNAFSTSLEAVSNNIANTQTTGFKRAQTDFSNLVTSLTADGGGIESGGVSANNRTLIAEQGAITRTNAQSDLAIVGDGFFVVSEQDNENAALAFTRAGGFRIADDGSLVNAAGYALRGAAIDASGSFSIGSLGGLETVNINAVPGLAAATSQLMLAGNLSAGLPVGESVRQNFQVFDADGTARTLALTFTANGGGSFAAAAAFADGAAETIATGTIAFDANGRLDQGASSFPSDLVIQTSGGQTVAANFGALASGPGATSFSTAETDGAAFAEIAGITISESGRITADFANGLSRDIFQIALANFTNPQGLEDGQNSTFQLTSLAGDLSLDIPQTGRAGAIEASALEISTVDIAQEFSTLIETQRAYSANTRVITIADELWQTLTQTAA
ncbi:MAG: flagellar hook-basal body complex protein [Pseudomonadota bacterium]